MATREIIQGIVTEVLDGTELKLKVDTIKLEENLENGEVKIVCDVHDQTTGEPRVVEAIGVGIIDALFHGLVDDYCADFPSLSQVRFADFSVKANLDTGSRSTLSDSTAEVSLTVANSDGREFTFVDESPSMTRSSVNVVVHAVSFFIGCERAFTAVYKALQHAKEAGRQDSIERYTTQLSTLVEATAYNEVIEQLNKA